MFRQDLVSYSSYRFVVLVFLFRYLPCCGIAWILYRLMPENHIGFAAWLVLIVLIRVFFGQLELALRTIVWRFTGHERLYNACTKLLDAHPFPNPSKMLHNGFLDYIKRIAADDYVIDEATKLSAKRVIDEWSSVAGHLENAQRKRYLNTMHEAFLAWFTRRWYNAKDYDLPRSSA